MKETKDNELLGKLSQLRDKLRGEKPPAPAKQTFYPPKPQAAAQAAPLETGSGPMQNCSTRTARRYRPTSSNAPTTR
jgi:hypothetical protein